MPAGCGPVSVVPEPTGSATGLGLPSSAWIRASCSSRCSSEGWVEVSVRSETPLTAGAMKNAFIALDLAQVALRDLVDARR